MKDFVRLGKGRFTFSNGDVYLGAWDQERMHGSDSVLTYAASEDVYEGPFNHNNKNGQGVYKFANGDVYMGDFEEDHMHGKGVYVYADGDRYEVGTTIL